MNKNTIIGFVLIGAILLGFSWYNSKIYKEQQRLKFVQDSTAAVLAAEQARVADSIRRANGDTIEVKVMVDSLKSAVAAPIYQDSLLEAASKDAGQLVKLANDKMELTLTTKGAQPYEVLLKEFFKYDSTGLYLVNGGGSNFAMNIYAGQQLYTSDFNFALVESTDSSAVMRLNFNQGAYIEHSYTLPSGSYMVDLKVKMVGMNALIKRNVSSIGVDWNLNLPRLEKGYDNEKNYSTIVYKYPGDDAVEDLGLRRDQAEQKLNTKVEWFAFQQQFFSAILYSPDNFTSGTLSQQFYPENNREGNLMACKSSMEVAYQPGESVEMPFQFYFGPNHFKTLRSYDHSFEKIVPLGGWLIGWINRVIIINCFDFLNGFISNYGIIILLLTILIKLVISPLTLKSYLSTAKMRVLKPEIEKINAKYPKKEDALKKQQETMALYKKTGVSMFGGCLPMLLQFPILFAMFRFFPASFELRQQSFLWADDLSTYDSVLNLPFSIPLYGDHVSLFALLMAISMFFYSKITMNQMPSNDGMPGMKFMQLYFMPLFLLVLCNNFSSGLSYYYMLSNFITIIQTWVIRKYFVDEKALYSKLQAKAASSKPAKKSKFQQRLDELYKQQQEQLRKQQGRR